MTARSISVMHWVNAKGAAPAPAAAAANNAGAPAPAAAPGSGDYDGLMDYGDDEDDLPF